jgi:hypothetical protein
VINNPNYLPQVSSTIHRTGNITTRDQGCQHHLQLNSSEDSSIHVKNLINVNQQDKETSSSSSSYQMQPTSPAQLAIAGQIRTAYQVSQRFSQSNAKYTGKTNESLAYKFQIYRTVARGYQLTAAQKVALVQNLFDEEAIRYYNSHVRDHSTTLEQVYEGMYDGFNSSPDRIDAFINFVLRLHTIMEKKNMTATEALDNIRDRITLMISQCPSRLPLKHSRPRCSAAVSSATDGKCANQQEPQQQVQLPAALPGSPLLFTPA